jgi:hypothetical protein
MKGIRSHFSRWPEQKGAPQTRGPRVWDQGQEEEPEGQEATDVVKVKVTPEIAVEAKRDPELLWKTRDRKNELLQQRYLLLLSDYL